MQNKYMEKIAESIHKFKSGLSNEDRAKYDAAYDSHKGSTIPRALASVGGAAAGYLAGKAIGRPAGQAIARKVAFGTFSKGKVGNKVLNMLEKSPGLLRNKYVEGVAAHLATKTVAEAGGAVAGANIAASQFKDYTPDGKHKFAKNSLNKS